MKRKVFLTRALIGILAVMMVPYGAFAQDTGTPGTFSDQDLDQMLAPIALYPDSLLAQVLIAATYPDQVTDADRWLKDNPGLKGDALNDALDRMNWDLSVKALAPFPQVLDMMAKESAWTQRLGEAFLAQQADVMDSVQKLRQKAQAAGNLKTTAEQKVVVQGENIAIEPVSPEVVYIPRYDPASGLRTLVVACVSSLRLLPRFSRGSHRSRSVRVLGGCNRGTGLGMGMGIVGLGPP